MPAPHESHRQPKCFPVEGVSPADEAQPRLEALLAAIEACAAAVPEEFRANPDRAPVAPEAVAGEIAAAFSLMKAKASSGLMNAFKPYGLTPGKFPDGENPSPTDVLEDVNGQMKQRMMLAAFGLRVADGDHVDALMKAENEALREAKSRMAETWAEWRDLYMSLSPLARWTAESARPPYEPSAEEVAAGWAAIVGSDIAADCNGAHITPRCLKEGIEAAARKRAVPPPEWLVRLAADGITSRGLMEGDSAIDAASAALETVAPYLTMQKPRERTFGPEAALEAIGEGLSGSGLVGGNPPFAVTDYGERQGKMRYWVRDYREPNSQSYAEAVFKSDDREEALDKARELTLSHAARCVSDGLSRRGFAAYGRR